MFKNKKMYLVLISVIVFSMLLVACGKDDGQTGTNYPEKPITVLQGFKAGGGSDSLAQITQPHLEKVLGQSFVNQYMPGATGAIAWNELAKQSNKDGYTLSITNTPMLMTNYLMNPEIQYNISEFEPIANVVTDPGVIVVGKDSKYNTIEDLLADAEANPGVITVGNSGVGGDDFFTTLIAERETGLEFKMVPFDGDGPSWQAAAGNKIDVSFNNLGITYPQIDAGNLKILAIFAEERDPMVPDAPTFKELGYDVVAGSSRGYSAPKGIPEEAKEALLAAFEEMGKNPDFLKGAQDRALAVDLKIGEDYKKYLQEQEEVFRGIWEEVKDQYQN